MSIIRRAQLETPLSASYANSSSYAETASFALNGGGTSVNTGSFVTTSSFAAFTSSYNTGSFTGSFTGTLIGTSSWAVSASRAVSSSYTLTASYVNPLQQDVIITGSIYIPDSTYGIYFSGSSAASKLTWNNTDGTLDLGLKGGDVTLQIGQESVIRVVNKTGANLLESQYKAVRIRRVDEGGAQGQRLAIVLAQANNDANSVDTLGLVTENINNNQEGFITTSGLVRNVDTTGTLQGETWADGDALYLSPTTAGAITKVKPQAPQHTVTVGYVVYAHVNNGKIFVKVDNGYEIDELHNVRITTSSLSSGDLLVYSSSVWINSKQLTGSYQITGSLLLSGSGLTVSSSRFQMPQYINITGSTRQLLATGSLQSLDWGNRLLQGTYGDVSVTWGTRTLNKYNFSTGNSWPVVDWDNLILKDGTDASNGILSIDWGGRGLYTPDGISVALSWNDNTVNYSDTYHYRYHDLTQQSNFVSQVLYSGEVIDAPTSGSVPQYSVVALSGSSWGTATSQVSITKMLGIALESGKSPSNILLNGDISFDGTDGPNIEPGLTPSDNGKPVYLKSSGFMTTTTPTIGYVRILGHVYYNNGTGYIFKFKPSNDWYKLS